MNGGSMAPQRITLSNSGIEKGIEAEARAVKRSPYGTLRQLANMPPKTATPLRRASSAGPSSHRSLHRTPDSQGLGTSAKRPNAVTPHGRAAMRELESRRAGLTPAKERRQSGRHHRETPQDALRALSRVLAPKSQPVVRTPEGLLPIGKFILPEKDNFDDDAALERPTLSLALNNDEEEDESFLLPPRSAGLEDESFTVQSIELPRRAASEQAPGRLSRGSFGSTRISDQFLDLNRGVVFDSSFAIADYLDEGVPGMDDGPQEEMATLRGLGLDRGRISLVSGRDSDMIPQTFTGDDTENTFVFTVPQREMLEQQDERLFIDPQESPNKDADGSDNWDGVDGVSAGEPGDFEEPDSLSSGSTRADVDVEMSIHDFTFHNPETSVFELKETTSTMQRKRKKVMISKHGVQFPLLPVGVVKKLATTYARTSGNGKAKISKETLDAIIQASDWFFEQVSDDLGAYADHAGRKIIDENDVIMLMMRQRQTDANTTMFSLAQRHLPRELLQQLRMAPLSKLKKGNQLNKIEEAEKDFINPFTS